MDGNLQGLMQQLGEAINESLSDSDSIAEAIAAINAAGYEVFLVLECTIGFNRREGTPESQPRTSSEPTIKGSGKPKFTSQDKRFMRALKISLGDDLDAPKK